MLVYHFRKPVLRPKMVMEEKLSETNVEVATVTKENGYQSLSNDDLQTYIKDLA